MNIKDAKEEIRRTLRAYTAPEGYRIPRVRQRPILLIGPPGIGKTAIVEQVAEECQAGFVSYTMTHHTRQSAIGLPFLKEKDYEGKHFSITEYTMSEIIASIYQYMEDSGHKTGILFIDEINCVSETRIRLSAIIRYQRGGSSWLPETRRNTISPYGSLIS